MGEEEKLIPAKSLFDEAIEEAKAGKSGGLPGFMGELKASESMASMSTVTITRTIPKSLTADGKEKFEEETNVLDIHKFVTVPAEIELTYGQKKMIEKFEPFEVRVSVRIPCYKEEIQEGYDFLQKFVEGILVKEMNSIDDMKAGKKTLSGGGSDEAKGKAGSGGAKGDIGGSERGDLYK